jgi:hypothetical protein
MKSHDVDSHNWKVQVSSCHIVSEEGKESTVLDVIHNGQYAADLWLPMEMYRIAAFLSILIQTESYDLWSISD